MIDGSIVALVTPMRDDGEVDFAALEKLLHFHLDSGTDGVVLGGTTGESATLREDELERMIAVARSTLGERMAIIAGTGTNDTRRSVERSVRACAAGADACLVVTPYYNRPGQEGLYRHYRAIADAVPRPLILYNVPSRTVCDLLPETVERLAAHPGIVALKEATPGRARGREILRRCGDRLALLSGDDATALNLMLEGARGVISVAANVVPRAYKRLCDLALAGQHDDARAVDESLRPLYEALFVETSPIPVKWALQRMGLIGGALRLPLTPLDPGCRDTVERALSLAGAV